MSPEVLGTRCDLPSCPAALEEVQPVHGCNVTCAPEHHHTPCLLNRTRSLDKIRHASPRYYGTRGSGEACDAWETTVNGYGHAPASMSTAAYSVAPNDSKMNTDSRLARPHDLARGCKTRPLQAISTMIGSSGHRMPCRLTPRRRSRHPLRSSVQKFPVAGGQRPSHWLSADHLRNLRNSARAKTTGRWAVLTAAVCYRPTACLVPKLYVMFLAVSEHDVFWAPRLDSERKRKQCHYRTPAQGPTAHACHAPRL